MGRGNHYITAYIAYFPPSRVFLLFPRVFYGVKINITQIIDEFPSSENFDCGPEKMRTKRNYFS